MSFIFKIYNTKFSISFYFVAFLALALINSKSHDRLFIALISTLIHELGHILMISRHLNLKNNEFIKEVRIELFSIDIVNNNFVNYKDNLLILISGSVFNFLVAIISLIFFYIFKSVILKFIVIENLLIGALNLLPISSLDGGQIFLILLKKKISLHNSEKIFFLPRSVS